MTKKQKSNGGGCT